MDRSYILYSDILHQDLHNRYHPSWTHLRFPYPVRLPDTPKHPPDLSPIVPRSLSPKLCCCHTVLSQTPLSVCLLWHWHSIKADPHFDKSEETNRYSVQNLPHINILPACHVRPLPVCFPDKNAHIPHRQSVSVSVQPLPPAVIWKLYSFSQMHHSDADPASQLSHSSFLPLYGSGKRSYTQSYPVLFLMISEHTVSESSWNHP